MADQLRAFHFERVMLRQPSEQTRINFRGSVLSPAARKDIETLPETKTTFPEYRLVFRYQGTYMEIASSYSEENNKTFPFHRIPIISRTSTTLHWYSAQPIYISFFSSYENEKVFPIRGDLIEVSPFCLHLNF